MKRVLSIAIVLASAFFLVSCNQDVDGGGLADSLSRSQMVTKKVVIEAYISEPGPETKTSIIFDNGEDYGQWKGYWSAHEHISLFYGPGANGGSDFTSTNTGPVDRTTFEGNISVITGIVEGDDNIKFWGVYPYNKDNTCDGSSITTFIHDTQYAVPGSWGNGESPLIGRADGLAMGFYNLCGFFRFFLEPIENDHITKITFKSNDGRPIAGKVKVVMDNGKPVVSQFLESTAEVSLLPDPQGTNGFFDETQVDPSTHNVVSGKSRIWYYLALPPNVWSEGTGITFTFYTQNDRFGTRTFNSKQEIKQSNYSGWSTALNRSDKVTFQSFVSIDPAELNLVVDQTQQLTVTLQPENSTNNVTWSSSDPSVASVSNDGLVTAVAPGTATITATTTEGNHSAGCEVTVTEAEDLATPLCLQAIEAGTITISNPKGLTIGYKKNSADWVDFNGATTTVEVAAGDRVYFHGNNATYGQNDDVYTNILCSAPAYVYGNVMSLINSNSFASLKKLTASLALSGLFRNNTGIRNHPSRELLLPATTLYYQCYRYMFAGCTGLITAPELPSMSVPSCGYKYMFSGCTSLVNPPELPATELFTNAYYSMFQGCTSLVTPPALPATTLAVECYRQMFRDCKALKSAPVLPATKMENHCYRGMFYGCNNLESAPSLPALQLAPYCYDAMFAYCRSLTEAPELPAITMEEGSYWDMFYGCWNLLTAPDLPATTLAKQCYQTMFYDCRKLTTAPDLLVETLVEGCYRGMFNACSKMNYIKMLALDVSATDALTNWTNGVAATGTFVKNYDATWDVTGSDGVPSGWTVQRLMTRDPVLVTSITLNKTSLSLNIGGDETLTATIAPENADEKGLTWTSGNTAIATVNQDGKVTAVGVGNTTITATAVDESGKTAVCTVTVNPIAVTSVTLNKSELSLAKGSSETLTATVKPDNATDKTVTWTSNKTSVATVDANGKVTAVGGGSATITATSGGKSATCAVTVTVPVTGVSLNKTSLSISVGETETLTATIAPSDASNKAVTWTSNKTSVATVDANGKITAVAVGSATITVKTSDGNKTATCAVTVNPIAVTSVTLNKSELSLTKGSNETLTVTVKPDNATDKTVTWTSNKTSVATVDANGKVTAVGGGSATITATSGGKSATCAVTVTVPVTGVSLNKTSMSLYIGDTETLTATIAPSDATNKSVTWTSNKTSVATVDANGKITAVAAGSATITVKTADGNKTATCAVTVNAIAVTGVTLNKSSLALTKGGTATLTATVSPENATDKTVTWTSNKTSVATVNSSGKVTAVAGGSATITATAGSKSATCVVTVTVPVSAISLNKTSLTLSIGGTETLTATITPSDATDKSITWSSNNTSVATVDANGKVTAIAGGSATITATAGGKSATCTVNVEIPVTSIKLYSRNLGKEVTSLSMYRCDEDELTVVCYPTNATNKAQYTNLSNQYWNYDYKYITGVEGSVRIDEDCPENITKPITVSVKGLTATCNITVLSYNATIVNLGLTVNWADRNLYSQSASEFGRYFVWSDIKNYEEDGWRLPTKAEMEELIAGCNITQETVNGVSGFRFTSIYNNNSIFLPDAGGYLNGEYYSNTQCGYWSKDGGASGYSGWRFRWVDGYDHFEVVETIENYSTQYMWTVRPVSTTYNSLDVTSVTLNRSTATIKVDGSVSLTATVKPDNATNKTVVWSSSDNSIATVSSTGYVRGIAPGSATITASAGQKQATCRVTVEPVNVTGVSLNKTTLTLDVGYKTYLTATVSPTNATNKNVTWTSSKTSVASVNSAGLVTANAPGIATITVKTEDGNKTATCEVTVPGSNDPTSISLNKTTMTMPCLDYSEVLTFNKTPENSEIRTVTWTSSKPSIATVDENGKVTSIASGTTVITCTVNETLQASCTVTVQSSNETFLRYKRNYLDKSYENNQDSKRTRIYSSCLSGFNNASVIKIKIKLSSVETRPYLGGSAGSYLGCGNYYYDAAYMRVVKSGSKYLIESRDDNGNTFTFPLSDYNIDGTDMLIIEYNGISKTFTVNGNTVACSNLTTFSFAYMLARFYDDTAENSSSDDDNAIIYSGIANDSKVYYIKAYNSSNSVIKTGCRTSGQTQNSSNGNTKEYSWIWNSSASDKCFATYPSYKQGTLMPTTYEPYLAN